MTSSNSEKGPFLRREMDRFFQTHERGDFHSKQKEWFSSEARKVLLVTLEPKAPQLARPLWVFEILQLMSLLLT